MKRNLTAQSETTFIAPRSPKGVEHKFGRDMADMVIMMGRIFKKQAIDALHVSTISKFSDALPSEFLDAQKGNYAKIFLKLSKAVQRKLLKRFNNDRLEKLAAKRLDDVDRSNRTLLYSKISEAVGVSAKELAATEGMKATRNALISETATWIKKTRDETLEYFTANTLRAMTLGQGLDAIMKDFDGMIETRKNHARFVAQNQINNYNSIMTRTRAVEVGVFKARWITEGDDLVRESHADRDGKEFDIRKGLYSAKDGLDLLPGVDYNCRCDYELIIPGTE